MTLFLFNIKFFFFQFLVLVLVQFSVTYFCTVFDMVQFIFKKRQRFAVLLRYD